MGIRQLFKIGRVFTGWDQGPGAQGGGGTVPDGEGQYPGSPCILLPPRGARPPAQGLPEVRKEAEHAWAGARLQPQPVCGEKEGRTGSGGQVVSWESGHADLGAALAQDGELGAPVHPAAGQGRVPVLEVHGKVAVHLPAPPLTLDLRLHLQGATGMVTSRQPLLPDCSAELLPGTHCHLPTIPTDSDEGLQPSRPAVGKGMPLRS